MKFKEQLRCLNIINYNQLSMTKMSELLFIKIVYNTKYLIFCTNNKILNYLI